MASTIGVMKAQQGVPANVEAEEFVLGSCVLAGKMLPEVAEALTELDFHEPKHRIIYRAIHRLEQDSRKIEYLTLVDALQQSGELEAAGGVAAIAGLTDGLPKFESIAEYVEIVAEKSRLRRAIEIFERGAEEAIEGRSKAAEITGKAASEMLQLDSRRTGDVLTLREAMEDEDTRRRILDPHRQGDAVETGFPDIDRMTGGFQPGNLLVLAARPSTGKTSFALNVATNVAKSKPVLFFTLESSREALFRRMICSEARIDSTRQRLGMLDADEQRRMRAAMHDLADRPVRITEAYGGTVGQISAVARKEAEKNGLGLIVVDYLQLMASEGRVENRTQEVSAFSRGLQRLGNELKVPVLALSQLSRAPEMRSDPKPRLSDLRESGAIEQDADLVMFLFRAEMYDKLREDLDGKAELDIAKHRDGATGSVNLTFLKNCTRFESIAESIYE